MTNTEKINVRFLMMNQKEVTLSFNSNSTWKEAKEQIFNHLKISENLSSPSQIRLIAGGKLLLDGNVIFSDVKIPKEGDATVHMLLSKIDNQPVAQQSQPIQQPQTEENEPQVDLLDDSNIHFHGCFFDEEEAEQIAFIFQKKKLANGKISVTQVYNFLKTYWRYMKTTKEVDDDKEFPEENFNHCKSRVLGDLDQNIESCTFQQFFQIFFLFDNPSSEETCPHGEKDRVEQATKQLFAALNPEGEFPKDVFDHIFDMVDIQKQGTLCCKEVDLLYHLFSLHVSFSGIELGQLNPLLTKTDVAQSPDTPLEQSSVN